jgi:hypothetical protein
MTAEWTALVADAAKAQEMFGDDELERYAAEHPISPGCLSPLDPDECAMMRERAVAGISNDPDACSIHGSVPMTSMERCPKCGRVYEAGTRHLCRVRGSVRLIADADVVGWEEVRAVTIGAAAVLGVALGLWIAALLDWL